MGKITQAFRRATEPAQPPPPPGQRRPIRHVVYRVRSQAVDAEIQAPPPGQPPNQLGLAQLDGTVRNNIIQGWQALPKLALLANETARPGWALRAPGAGGGPPVKPSRAQFVAHPDVYLLALLARVYELCVSRSKSRAIKRWNATNLHVPGFPNVPLPVALRFGLQHRLMDGEQALPGVGTNLCLPMAEPPRKKRPPKRTRRLHHYLTIRGSGYVQVYLGCYTWHPGENDPPGQEPKVVPIKEYLHRLLLLAFHGAPPNPQQREASHCCCHKWCGNAPPGEPADRPGAL